MESSGHTTGVNESCSGHKVSRFRSLRGSFSGSHSCSTLQAVFRFKVMLRFPWGLFFWGSSG